MCARGDDEWWVDEGGGGEGGTANKQGEGSGARQAGAWGLRAESELGCSGALAAIWV